MRREVYLGLAGATAAIWAAVHGAGYFQQDGPLGPASAELPMTIRIFYGSALFAGIAGGAGLAFRRRWAAFLLWVSWLGVLIEGAWAPALFTGRLQLGAINFLLATVFAVLAEWNTRLSVAHRAAASASQP